MQFSYKLTEADYLLACGIAIKKPGPSWRRLLPYAYFILPLSVVWGAFVVGMLLERSDLIGVPVEIRKLPPIGPIVSASFLPAFVYTWVFWLAIAGILRRRYRERRIKHFRTDPGCQAETTAKISPDSVSFRSTTGSSESVWECYETWAECNGILLLVTRAGARKILKISGLSDNAQQELRGVLAAALPKK